MRNRIGRPRFNQGPASARGEINPLVPAVEIPFTPTGNISSTNVQAAIVELDNEKVAKAGDTMTGNLTIGRNQPALELRATVQSDRLIAGTNATGQLRWFARFGNSTVESGSNAGSNFEISRYSDAGALLGTPLAISRATGVVDFALAPTVAGVPISGGGSGGVEEAPNDGTLYGRQNEGWSPVVIPPVVAFIGDGPPIGPVHGQLWWESDTGTLFIYYNDGTSPQWVPATGTPTIPLFPPIAPILELLTGPSDNTPDFTITGDLVETDTVRFQYSTASDFTGTSELTNTIDAAEDAANSISLATGTLADDTWYFRARIERPVQGNSPWSNTESITIAAASSYVGPGDVVSGWYGWWGLRAYSSAAIGSNVIRIKRASDAAESDFITLAGGHLDIASIATFLSATTGTVVALYDQSGNGRHINVVATTGTPPIYTPAGLGSLPVMTWDATARVLSTTTTHTYPQPFTTCMVFNAASTSTRGGLLISDGAYILFHNTVINDVEISNGGPSVTISMTSGVWHTGHFVFNDASSNLYIDGASNAGNIGGSGGASNYIFLGAIGAGGALPYVGAMAECGIHPTVLSAPNIASLDTNQQTYWGF